MKTQVKIYIHIFREKIAGAINIPMILIQWYFVLSALKVSRTLTFTYYN